MAVAEVVLNRVSDRRFPGTVCGVTRQGAGSGKGCQFSYACDGNSDAMKSALPRSRAEKIATMMLAGRARTRHRRGDLLPHPLGPPRLVAPVGAHRLDRPPPVLSLGHPGRGGAVA